MKTNNRPFPFVAAFLLGAACISATVASAATKPEKAAKSPRTTTETSYIGPATEQVVVTQKYKDGTVIRVVQILHADGTTETSGERRGPASKS